MSKLRSCSWALCLIFVFAGGLASAQQAAIDPQSLIGAWMGTFSTGSNTGEYILTLTRFENGIYYARGQTSGIGQGNTISDLEGKLAGNLLTLTNVDKTGTLEFKVDGDKMAGEGCGRRACVKILLQRNK